jgi:hypothetical protein
VILKGRGPHDFKFGGAVLEDVAHVSKPWRGNYLAGSVFSLQGATKADNPLIERIRCVLC